jgi:glycerol-3-phosphate acyltransferase PlsY
MRWAAVLVAAYLVGSVSWSVLIVRLVRGADVRSLGSGNAGATNVLRAAGAWPAVAALVLDLAKGAAAVGVARLAGAPPPVAAGAAVAVVLGHVFPVFFGLRGGKGAATAIGALGVLAPAAAVGALAVFAAVLAVSRYVSLASVLAAAAFPLLVLALRAAGVRGGGDRSVLAAAVAAALLIVARHAANLRRLAAGREPRVGAGRGGPRPDSGAARGLEEE